MPRTYLYGPISLDYAADYLAEFRRERTCWAFNAAATVDLHITALTTWAEVLQQCPEAGTPEAIFLNLAYQEIPPALWTAPVPLIGLACDWNLLWHAYRHAVPRCDLVFTDAPGVDRMHAEGWDHVRPAFLYGYGASFTPFVSPAAFRDFDVLFVGNLHPDVQAARLPWLGRLAALSDRCRVRIATGVFGEEYRRLLTRARLVFNHSIRGEANQRAAEALAAGALLLQESSNRELSCYLEPDQDYVTYDVQNLEEVVLHWVTQEPKRCEIVAAAQAKLPALSFASHWRQLLAQVQSIWPDLQARVAARLTSANSPPIHQTCAALTTLEAAATSSGSDPEITAALTNLQAHLGHASFIEIEATAAPRRFDAFRIAWEQSAWTHAGMPDQERELKRQLLGWQTQHLLAKHTGRIPYLYEALRVRPDCPTTHQGLGLALVQEGLPQLASRYLASALAANPFNAEVARRYAEMLRALGQEAAFQDVAKARWNLACAAPALIDPETWFTPPAPSEQELVTIIIPCCNRWELTRTCIESLRRWTRAPWELIIVDNGSTDETAPGLAALTQLSGPVRIKILRNSSNRGFAAACNQGLAAAQGRYLVLLNNDTEVTPDWLDRMIACLRSQWPVLGLVGPVTDYAPPPQLVSGPSAGQDLAIFARHHRAAHAGQALHVPRLSGFCWLTVREVLDRVGPLDEDFGLGFFEDDDWCVRVRDAGFRLAVVQDVFVRHHGSQTFAGLNLDAPSLLDANFTQFAAKWGPARAAGYRPWHSPPSTQSAASIPAAPASPVLPGVSLTMIVKNEEANLAECLAPVRDLVQQLVIVDTGSTDRTREIATTWRAEVYDFPWIDSFAAARNEALRRARHSWCFWMDADDRLDAANAAALRDHLSSLSAFPAEVMGFSMKCLCLARVEGAPTAVDHVRLFRNHPRLRWEYRVHEQILPAIRRLGGLVRFAPVRIHHVGYLDSTLRRRKLDRDLRLLRLENQERPDDPFTLFNLGAVYLELHQKAEALNYLERSLALSHPNDSIVRKLYALISQTQRALGRLQEALTACTTGRAWYPEDVELLFQEALVRRELGDLLGAKSCLETLLQVQPGEHFASVDTSLAGYKAWHNLAVVCEELDLGPEAEFAWQKLLKERPEYAPAWAGLGELYLAQERWEALEEVVARWAQLPDADSEPLRLRTAGLIARRAFPQARDLLSQLIARDPEILWPRLYLSRTYLQEGVDWEAAERALEQVLALDPKCREANQNLAVLRRQKGSTARPTIQEG